MHIFYVSPLKTKISKSQLDEYLKINHFKYLTGVENHQNAIITIAYGLVLLNKEFNAEVNFFLSLFCGFSSDFM